MRRKTKVWILVIWILGQILSTICSEMKYADPIQNVTILQRYRRSGTIFTYFSNLDKKVTSTRRYANKRARRYMRFSGRRVQVGNKIVMKLTCDITRHTHQLISGGVRGVLILHKRHQSNKKFTKVVGLTSNGNIMFNKQLNWQKKMNQKSAASRAPKQKLGYGRLHYFIPGDKCNIQAGLFYCQIYGNKKPKYSYRLQWQYRVTKAQCTPKLTVAKKKTKPKSIESIKGKALKDPRRANHPGHAKHPKKRGPTHVNPFENEPKTRKMKVKLGTILVVGIGGVVSILFITFVVWKLFFNKKKSALIKKEEDGPKPNSSLIKKEEDGPKPNSPLIKKELDGPKPNRGPTKQRQRPPVPTRHK